MPLDRFPMNEAPGFGAAARGFVFEEFFLGTVSGRGVGRLVLALERRA